MKYKKFMRNVTKSTQKQLFHITNSNSINVFNCSKSIMHRPFDCIALHIIHTLWIIYKVILKRVLKGTEQKGRTVFNRMKYRQFFIFTRGIVIMEFPESVWSYLDNVDVLTTGTDCHVMRSDKSLITHIWHWMIQNNWRSIMQSQWYSPKSWAISTLGSSNWQTRLYVTNCYVPHFLAAMC